MSCQKAIFGAYRTDQYADPEVFKVSLGAVLEQFPDEVITYISDPRTGIQRRSEWPPTISKVVDACEQHQDFLAKLRVARPAFMERKPEPLLYERPQGYMAQVFVPEGHSRYAKFCEWAENADPIWWKYGKSSDNGNGIWVSHNAWNGLPDPK